MMIDKQTILERADLLTLAEHDTRLKKAAGTEGGEWAGPCPFCGGTDRFRVQPSRRPYGLWMCRQCTNGKWKNAIDYVIKRDSCDFKTACQNLTGGDLPTTRERRQPTPIPAYSPSGGDWQSNAWAAVEQCAANLWDPGGARALDYLRGRGLQDDVIRYYWLGYSLGETWGDLYVRAGIVIPCMAANELWYLKIALLPGDPVKCKCKVTVPARQPCPHCGENPKYRGVTGNRTAAIFGADNLAGCDAALFVEGEFNAMIADQALYSAIAVCSIGAAGNKLDLASWGAYLLNLRDILVYYDPDQAGESGKEFWESLTNRARVCQLPEGVKDINDFYLAGGDLCAWLAEQADRLGLLSNRAEVDR